MKSTKIALFKDEKIISELNFLSQRVQELQ